MDVVCQSRELNLVYKGARECVSFVNACIYVATHSVLEQTHAVCNAAWVVDDSYIC